MFGPFRYRIFRIKATVLVVSAAVIWNSCNENMQHAETKKYTWNILYEIVTCLCMESLKQTVDYLAAFPYSIVNDSPSLYLVRLKVTHCFAFAAFSHLITRSREHLITCACRNMISMEEWERKSRKTYYPVDHAMTAHMTSP